MISQQAHVLSALRSGDLVYVRVTEGSDEGIYSFGCATAFGPILIAETLVLLAWSQAELLPPF